MLSLIWVPIGRKTLPQDLLQSPEGPSSAPCGSGLAFGMTVGLPALHTPHRRSPSVLQAALLEGRGQESLNGSQMARVTVQTLYWCLLDFDFFFGGVGDRLLFPHLDPLLIFISTQPPVLSVYLSCLWGCVHSWSVSHHFHVCFRGGQSNNEADFLRNLTTLIYFSINRQTEGMDSIQLPQVT